MEKIAIFIDGGFYRKRAALLWGKKTPEGRASELFKYCMDHVQHANKDQLAAEKRELYRIFYYDCDPLSKIVYHPLTKENIDFKKRDTYQWTLDFFDCLKAQRKMCVRKGVLLDSDATFVLKPDSTKQLLSGKKLLTDLTETDFSPSWRQKGVDMKLGIDVASVAYKKQVDKIILVAGDSDFVPAAKVARREGIDIILDPMWQSSVAENLREHVDGIYSCWKKNKKKSAEKNQ